MVLIIKRGASSKEINAVEKKLLLGKHGFNPDKYNGKIKFRKSALLIQKELRNEWERTISRH